MRYTTLQYNAYQFFRDTLAAVTETFDPLDSNNMPTNRGSRPYDKRNSN